MNSNGIYDFKISAPVEDIHFCPICHRPFLDEPVKSGLVKNLLICPHCKDDESDFFFYWMNYKPFLAREEVHTADDRAAVLINGKDTYIAFRVEGGWDYTLLDENGELIESGQLDEESLSFEEAMRQTMKECGVAVHQYEILPWATASAILHFIQ